MSNPLVSVVMPAYNAAQYIGEAIDSVLEQQYKDFELIIIDDASTDNTSEIIGRYRDARILTLRNDENQGIVISRNRGLAIAKGSYVAILDSDDIALPDRLEKQVAFLESNPDHAACGSYYIVIGPRGKKLASVTVPVNAQDTKTFLYFNVCFCHSTLMMRAGIAREFQYRPGFDIIEDYEIAYRISRAWKVGNVPSFTTLYRIHGHNISIDKKLRMLEVRRRMDSLVLKDLEMPFTEDELDLHSNFINMNESFFKQKVKMEELENWLIRFYAMIKTQPQVNPSMVLRILAVRWFLICFRTRHFGLMFRNHLFRGFRAAYLRYNLLHMKKVLTGRMEVV